MGHLKYSSGGQHSEGADVETTSLSGITLSATLTGGLASFTSWACTDCPSSGDVEFPTGTTTGAVDSGLADASAASTTVTVPGPGRYEFTATWSDGITETITVRVTRPTPACAVAWVSGGPDANGDVTPGAAFQFTVSDANGADSVGFSATVFHLSGAGAASVSLTESPEGTFSGTWPAQANDGRAVIIAATSTDAYGRTAVGSDSARMPGLGPGNVTAPTPTYELVAASGTASPWTYSGFTDPLGRIDNYLVQDFQVSGSPTRTGSDLGAHTPTVAQGEILLNTITARDASNGHLATSARVIARATATQVTATVSGSGPFTRATTTADAGFTIVPAGGSGSYSYALQGSATLPGGAATSGTTTTTPSFTSIDTDGLHLMTIRVSDAADASNYVDVVLGHVYDSTVSGGGGGGSGASWVDVWEQDLTTDMTTLALTNGGGEEQVYEADGTTPKIKTTYYNRAGAPTSTAEANTANGGLKLDVTAGSSNNAAAVSVNLSETETGAVWDDSYLYAIDVLLTGCDMTAGTNGYILCGPGTKAAGINSGFSMTHRHRRASGTSFTQSGRRYEGGSASVGADQVNNSSIAADIALRFLVTNGGHTVTLFWAEQTAYLSSTTLVPVTGASLWKSFSGSNAFSIEAAAEFRFNANQPYLHLDLQYSGSGTASATVGKIRIQRWE